MRHGRFEFAHPCAELLVLQLQLQLTYGSVLTAVPRRGAAFAGECVDHRLDLEQPMASQTRAAAFTARRPTIVKILCQRLCRCPVAQSRVLDSKVGRQEECAGLHRLREIRSVSLARGLLWLAVRPVTCSLCHGARLASARAVPQVPPHSEAELFR